MPLISKIREDFAVGRIASTKILASEHSMNISRNQAAIAEVTYILYIRNAIRNVSSMPHGSSSQDSSLSHARARADTHQLLLLVYLKEIFSLGELLPS